MRPIPRCSDCDVSHSSDLLAGSDRLAGHAVTRRDFVKVSGTAAIAAATVGLTTGPNATPVRAEEQAAQASAAQPEKLVETLYQSLTPQQKEKICFDWDYTEIGRAHV